MSSYFAEDQKDREVRRVLDIVYSALEEKGYDPCSQIAGYVFSEDPHYITIHKDARKLITNLDRDDIMEALLHSYFNK